jgi:hypothetical protein
VGRSTQWNLQLPETLEHHRCLDAVTAANHFLAPTARGGDGVESVALRGLMVDGLLQGGQVVRRLPAGQK